MSHRRERNRPGDDRPPTGQAPAPGLEHRSLRGVITDAIRQSILNGSLAPGERLVEDRLATEYAVSRNPVREALQSLATEGLVEMIPRRGAVVASLSDEEVHELIELRASLEGLCARLAARRSRPDLRERLRAMLKRGEQALADNDLEVLCELNGAFHILLAEAGHNRFLADFMASLRDRTHWMHISTQSWRATKSWNEHAAILRAVESGDEELAALLASRHVANAGIACLEGKSAETLRGAEAPLQVVGGTP